VITDGHTLRWLAQSGKADRVPHEAVLESHDAA
jgi:hypothetical protein